MKKLLAIPLSLLMMVGMLAGCGAKDTAPAETKAPAAEAPATEAAEASCMEELIAAAQAEGTLVVYGSCEEEYLAAACEKSQELYGIEVQYQRLSPVRFRAMTTISGCPSCPASTSSASMLCWCACSILRFILRKTTSPMGFGWLCGWLGCTPALRPSCLPSTPSTKSRWGMSTGIR